MQKTWLHPSEHRGQILILPPSAPQLACAIKLTDSLTNHRDSFTILLYTIYIKLIWDGCGHLRSAFTPLAMILIFCEGSVSANSLCTRTWGRHQSADSNHHHNIKKHILPDHKQKSFVIWIVNSAMHEDTIKSFSTHQPPRQVPQIHLAATQFGIVPTSALVAGTKNCLDSSHIAIDQN